MLNKGSEAYLSNQQWAPVDRCGLFSKLCYHHDAVMYQCQTCIKYCLAFCYVYQPLCRLGLASSFDQQARGAVLDLTGDDNEEIRRSQNTLKWYVLSTSLHKNYSVPAKNTCSCRYIKICDKNYNIMIRKIICTIIMVHIIFQIRIAHGPYNHKQNFPI